MLAFEKFIDEQLHEKRIIDSYGVKYFNDIDISVCDYVLKNLDYQNYGIINPGNRIDECDLFYICLDELKILGEDIISKVRNMSFGIRMMVADIDNACQLGTGLSFEKDENGVVNKKSGIVSMFVLPKKIYEISGLLFGHEYVHAMKDTNYEEYINHKVLGETIPIFYEFMIYNPDEVLKKELIKFRMIDIAENGYEYVLLNNAYRASINCEMNVENIRKRDFCKYNFLKKICYLNSFYYALILYNMYKENPKKILNMVSMVLKHELTTLEMLEQLGIYGDIRGEVFEKEIQNIRKLVK